MEKLSTRRPGVKIIYAGAALTLAIPAANNFAGSWIAANSNIPRMVSVEVYEGVIESFDPLPGWKFLRSETLDTGDLPQFTDTGW